MLWIFGRCGPAAYIATALFLWLVSHSVLAAPVEREFLIVEGAQGVQEHQTEDGLWGIFYTVELTYPARAIGEPQWNQLKAAGWTRCRGGDRDWVSFEDRSIGLVHQHVTHWFRGDRTITIGLRYYSWGLRSTDKVAPSNNGQFVDITFDDDPKRRDSVMWLALGCS